LEGGHDWQADDGEATGECDQPQTIQSIGFEDESRPDLRSNELIKIQNSGLVVSIENLHQRTRMTDRPCDHVMPVVIPLQVDDHRSIHHESPSWDSLPSTAQAENARAIAQGFERVTITL
jgi:hypothetical protein